jgi:hypothetical protein
MTRGYVDADGHIMELITYLEEPWRSLEPVIPDVCCRLAISFIPTDAQERNF